MNRRESKILNTLRKSLDKVEYDLEKIENKRILILRKIMKICKHESTIEEKFYVDGVNNMYAYTEIHHKCTICGMIVKREIIQHPWF